MRWAIVWAIFRKELLETLRDRRTLVVMLLLPMALYPVLMIGLTQVVTHQISQMESASGRVLVKGPLPVELRRLITAEKTIRIQSIDEMKTADDRGPETPLSMRIIEPTEGDKGNPFLRRLLEPMPELKAWAGKLILAQKTDLVIVIPENSDVILRRTGSCPVMLYFDQTNHISRTMEERISQILIHWQYQMRQDRIKAFPMLPGGFEDPVVSESENTANAERRGGYIAGQILPMMLMIMVMLGAFYPAIDLTAGEKERGTMQTLMTAPALALEIIAGKFMTVFLVAMISAVANLGSMALALLWIIGSMPMGDDGALALSVTPMTLVLVFLQLVPIAVFFSALMLAVAIFAQSFKEAQNYLTPIYMLVILPAILGALPVVKLDGLTAVTPGLNFVLLIREMFIEQPPLAMVGLVLLSNTMYALLALAAAAHIFQNEQVMLGSQGSFFDLFRRSLSGAPRATPLLSMTAFASLLLLILYIGTPMQQKDIFFGMLATQALLIALPALVIPRSLRLNISETLQLRLPSWRAVVGSVLLGLSAWLVLSQSIFWAQNQFMPVPPNVEKMFNDALDLTKLPIWQVILAFAVAPAVCEELLFRGLLFGGLRPLGKWWSIAIAGLLFGMFHISIYRILPVGALGALIAWVAWQSRSLWPGVVLHLIHNGLLLLVGVYQAYTMADPTAPGFVPADVALPGWMISVAPVVAAVPDWVQIVVGIFAFAGGIALVASVRRPAEADADDVTAPITVGELPASR